MGNFQQELVKLETGILQQDYAEVPDPASMSQSEYSMLINDYGTRGLRARFVGIVMKRKIGGGKKEGLEILKTISQIYYTIKAQMFVLSDLERCRSKKRLKGSAALKNQEAIEESEQKLDVLAEQHLTLIDALGSLDSLTDPETGLFTQCRS